MQSLIHTLPVRRRGQTSRALATLTVLTLLSALPLSAQNGAPGASDRNWPQWRGPLVNGVAPAANPPLAWSETSNVKWKVKLPGSGSGTPAVWEGRVFVQAAIPTGKKGEAPAAVDVPNELYQFVLLCLDQKTGKTLWQQVAREEVPHEGHHRDHGFSSYSPVTDGNHVYAYFGSRGLYCYDLTGSLKWKKDLGRMRTKMSFGEGSSPALFGDTLVINWDHEGADFVVALDKRTGDELWRQAREEDTTWTTPLIVQHEGKAQVITAGTRRIRSYDLASGKLIWETGGLTPNVIPTPVAAGGTVYATSGFRGNALLAIRLGREGDLTGTDAITWSHRKSTPYVPSPLLYDNRLYFFAGNTGVLSCFDVNTGKPLIDAERVEGLTGVYASPVGAGGRVYLLGRNGAAVVIKHADKLEVLATNRLDERFDASPAVAGDELFLRGHEHLYCIAEK